MANPLPQGSNQEWSPPEVPHHLTPETTAPPSDKILVVDDEQSARESVVELLRLEGYVVAEASDGESALNMLQGEHFDIVMTDLIMPRMGGLALLKACQQLEHRAAFIVMTGFASLESAVEAMKLGAVEYLPKPCNLELLRIVVARTLEKMRMIEQAKQCEFYRKLAQTDGLTDLYNHRFFHQLLTAEMSRAQRFNRALSLIMVDVDLFKVYNDNNGHPMGDRALQQLAWLLKNSNRNYDLIARYGGEEFALILPETDKRTAIEVAERIRTAVGKTPFEQAEVLPGGRFTISLGVSSFPQDAQEKGDLLQKADLALYRAKALGRDRVCFYDEDR